MAKIWFVRRGSEPTRVEPRYTLPLKQCVGQLGLAQRQWLCGLGQRPVIDEESPLPQDYQHVICRVDHQEASEHGWEAGYYRLDLRPKEVARRLDHPN